MGKPKCWKLQYPSSKQLCNFSHRNYRGMRLKNSSGTRARLMCGFLLTLAVMPERTAAAVPQGSASDTYVQLDHFVEAFEEIRRSYVDPVSDQTLIKGAISGMVQSLDPHSAYLDQSDFDQMKMQTEGSYGGLGLTLQMDDGVVKVVAPTEDTPAYRAGIKPGDLIIRLDGRVLSGGKLSDATDGMKGKPGTKVVLTIMRPGRDAPFDVPLVRETIQLKSVKWSVKDNIGVIRITGFSRSTGADTRAAIAGVERQTSNHPTGFIVDLRSNPGGLLDQAIEVSDAFLDRGEIVSQRGREKTDIERYYAKPGDLTQGAPMVVLVDAGSASAAEIVAGALQDDRRAIVLGERTFGKGSVQTLLPLDENTALKLTTARYYTPSGRSVQEGGIAPDITVPQLSDPDYKNRPRVHEYDLARHLVNDAKIDDGKIEADEKVDPRFTLTAPDLKKMGITDFQLDYAVKTLARLADTPRSVQPAAVPTRRS